MPANIIRDLFLVQQRFPKLRIGQIIVNAARKGGWESDDVFYCPNDILSKGLREMLEK